MAAPFWERFCTPLARNILAVLHGPQVRAGGDYILEEHVAEVLDDGTYRVGGDVLRTKGKATLDAGQRVHVLWRGGRRALILTHQWRRTQGQVWGQPQGAVVETLFIAPNPSDGRVEVWFRNDAQVTNLGLRVDLDADPVFVRWGVDPATFVVMTETHTFTAYVLDRPARDGVFGTRVPTVALLWTEEPLDGGHVLYAQRETSALSGETTYFVQGAWPVDDWPAQVPVAVAGTLPIAKTVTRIGDVMLTRLAIEGDATHAPTAVLTDVTLDAARHLILSIAVLAGSQTPAVVSGSAVHKVWTDDAIPGAEVDTFEPDPHMTVGSWGAHLIVLDATASTVLFRTCKETIRQEITAEVHRMHTIQAASESEFGQSFGGPWYAGGPDKYQGFSGTPPAPGTVPALDFTGLVSGYGTSPADMNWGSKKPGITGAIFDECEPFDYLDLTGLLTTETFTSETWAGAHWFASGGFSSAPSYIRVTRAHRRTWQRRFYSFSGIYIPRPELRPDLTPVPGLVFVHVSEATKTTYTGPAGSPRQGFYLHDLDADTITPVVPIAANAAANSGVHLATTPPRFFYHLDPATSQTFVVLGFDGRFLYWMEFHADSSAEIKVTNVETGATSVVATGSAAVPGEGLVGAAGIAPALKSVLDRTLQVLAPEVMYYPSDDAAVPEDRRNVFVDAWDPATGVPLLDADLPTFPPPREALKGAGAQAALPAGVVPTRVTAIAVNAGPVNLVDFAATGPSWHVIQTPALLALL